MKRDLDLIRELLKILESKETDKVVTDFTHSTHSEIDIKYHYLLMYKAGLIRAEAETTNTGRIIKVHPFSLTWQGHEFLDLSRNSKFWTKAKEIAIEKTGSVSFDAISSILTKLAHAALS